MIGCLLIHGFTGSPYEVEPVARRLAKYGWRIESPVLAGHEGHSESLGRVTWHDWVHTAEEALKNLLAECETVYIVGFSMGGLIAAHLSTRYPVDKLVMLSASLFYINPQQLFHDVASLIKSNFKNAAGSKELFRRYAAKVKTTPPRAVIHFRHLVRVLKNDISHVTTPALIIQGGKDDLVEPRSAHYIYDHIASKEKELHILPDSKHIICHDCEQEMLLSLIESFLLGEKTPQGGAHDED
ncbi:alpha/beta fold hydrolase [Aneurinibacillus sp. Ricciae_BoGa-3]|uniref:alpha/beta hydrolase n=1 Tax=Aneurinibacillus sp. Ricciae_BoGa-3 TaxID=3022697 RepID=UPI00233FB4B6|nr:alpha/beta fold hydrolase [Aneurinibacillus sp. Ricciae_BoGa-3]WCK54113.1 alpha/beta fold hydrolase [Aneurinibacillus sp. Ricciae_BoGa-3]